MKRLIYMVLSAVLVFAAGACQKDEVKDTGITNLSNPMQGKNVYYKGESVKIEFSASAAWTAELSDASADWVEIDRMYGKDSAGDGCYVRLNFFENETGADRQITLWIQVQGKQDKLGVVLTQASEPEASKMSEFLNAQMDNVLQEKYLWAEAYRGIKKDMTVSYDNFLYNHLTMLGDVNIEDGGLYRAYSSNSGKRYIYSYIQEVVETKAVTRAGTLTENYGLGIGPLFASPTGVEDNIYLL
jgi:hypothetical protein